MPLNLAWKIKRIALGTRCHQKAFAELYDVVGSCGIGIPLFFFCGLAILMSGQSNNLFPVGLETNTFLPSGLAKMPLAKAMSELLWHYSFEGYQTRTVEVFS